MAVKKHRRVKGKGASSEAPFSPAKRGGIKKRTNLPIEPDIPDFPGELGAVVESIVKDGHYGSPFIKASSRRMDRGYSRVGTLALDLALGGGWRKSSAGMMYGEKSSGKSTLALQSIATLHREDPEVFAGWVDVEGTLDKGWARKLGVDLDRLAVVEPETGEHAVDLADAMLRANNVGIVVTDSIAMIVSMKELDESAEQDTMALQARLVGKYIRRTNNAVIKERARGHEPILLHINQFRMKVGLVFGDPRVLPGGKALEFSTTQQIEIKNKEHMGKDDDKNSIVEYNEHNFKITKNKGGGPMREGAFKLIRHTGYDGLPETWVDQAKTIYLLGSQVGVVTGSPTSYEVDGVSGKFRGAPAFNKWALENTDEYHEVQAKIIAGFRSRWNL